MRIDPDSVDKNAYNFINPLLVDPKDNNTLYMPVGKRIARFDNIRKLEVVSSTSKLKTGWTFLDTITTPNISSGNVSYPPDITAIALTKSNPIFCIWVPTTEKFLEW